MWSPCRGSPNRAKLVLSLHIKGLSYESPDRCRRRGCMVFPSPSGAAPRFYHKRRLFDEQAPSFLPTGIYHRFCHLRHELRFFTSFRMTCPAGRPYCPTACGGGKGTGFIGSRQTTENSVICFPVEEGDTQYQEGRRGKTRPRQADSGRR